MATEKSKSKKPTEAQLEKRATARGYTLEKDDGKWYAVIGGTRYGPMASLDELDDFLPEE
jgi:hypothetical protein